MEAKCYRTCHALVDFCKFKCTAGSGNTCWHFSAGVEEKDFFASHGTTYLHLTSLP